eukprot:UN10916
MGEQSKIMNAMSSIIDPQKLQADTQQFIQAKDKNELQQEMMTDMMDDLFENDEEDVEDR